MKIRAITLGCPVLPDSGHIRSAGEMLKSLRVSFGSEGYEVQSLRLALPRWNQDELTGMNLTRYLVELNEQVLRAGIDFCSLGVLKDPVMVGHIVRLLPSLSTLNCSIGIADTTEGVDRGMISSAALAIDGLSRSSDEFTNFRLGASACLGPHTPYFPGAFHEGAAACFSIGLENSDILVSAFRRVQNRTDLDEAKSSLATLLTGHLTAIESLALEASSRLSLCFAGIDTSIAPSVSKDESIVSAFSYLGVEFGSVGTLAVCSAITDVVKSIPVRRVGYCGLMLLVLEDYGLATYSGSRLFNITNLLAYSSVCGVGIDMVPVAGATLPMLEQLMLDLASLSLKLRKPLLLRLLPLHTIPVGGLTQFQSPYIVNATVVSLRP